MQIGGELLSPGSVRLLSIDVPGSSIKRASEARSYNRSGTFPLRLFLSNDRVTNCQD